MILKNIASIGLVLGSALLVSSHMPTLAKRNLSSALSPAPSVSSPIISAPINPPMEVPAAITPVPIKEPVRVSPSTIAAPKKLEVNKSEFEMPLDVNRDAGKEHTLTPVHITLSVRHHDKNCASFLAAYPSPTLPPKVKAVRMLDTNVRSLKTLIEQTSYTRRNTRTIAYPTGGWRWQEVYGRALNRSGKMEPHLLTNMYLFRNAVLPYCYEEAKRSNEFEEKRQERYQQCIDDYKELRADAETEATRRGLQSQLIKYKKYFENGDRQGTVNLAPGQWWIVASHKIPGLTYYWQQPVVVHEGQESLITLNEENALVIDGAW